MKARDRVRIIAENEPQDDFSFIGMTGVVVQAFDDGAIIDIDREFWEETSLNHLFFEYKELERIVGEPV